MGTPLGFPPYTYMDPLGLSAKSEPIAHEWMVLLGAGVGVGSACTRRKERTEYLWVSRYEDDERDPLPSPTFGITTSLNVPARKGSAFSGSAKTTAGDANEAQQTQQKELYVNAGPA